MRQKYLSDKQFIFNVETKQIIKVVTEAETRGSKRSLYRTKQQRFSQYSITVNFDEAPQSVGITMISLPHTERSKRFELICKQVRLRLVIEQRL
jgi:hypothetical protein